MRLSRTITARVGTAVSYGFTAAMTSLCVMAAWTALAPTRNLADETCLSNLRQIGVMSRMYTDDYDGCLVPYVLLGSTATKTYAQLLIPYHNSPALFRCPLDHMGRPTPTPARVPTTYGVNWYLSGSSGAFGSNILPPRRSASIHDPGGTIWAADTALILPSTAALPPSGWKEDLTAARDADLTFFYLPQDPNTGASTTGNSTSGASGYIVRVFPRHNGRVNAAFYDGHAAAVPESQFDPSITRWGQPGCLWDNVAG